MGFLNPSVPLFPILVSRCADPNQHPVTWNRSSTLSQLFPDIHPSLTYLQTQFQINFACQHREAFPTIYPLKIVRGSPLQTTPNCGPRRSLSNVHWLRGVNLQTSAHRRGYRGAEVGLGTAFFGGLFHLRSASAWCRRVLCGQYGRVIMRVEGMIHALLKL